MLTKEQVVGALKKLGQATAADIAKDLGVKTPTVMYHLQAMVTAGAAARTGKRNALFSLKSSPASAAKKRRKIKRSPVKAERFIAAIDADARLVIVTDSEPVLFSEPQTEQIATLLLTHYKA